MAQKVRGGGGQTWDKTRIESKLKAKKLNMLVKIS
jgi:hypothetical protein